MLNELQRAVMFGKEQTFNKLIEEGADINVVDEKGRTLLMWTANAYCNEAHYRIAKKLIELGMDINQPDHDGNTPLHWAVSTRYADTAQLNSLVKLFIENGAEIDFENKNGVTPLMRAAEEAPLDLLEVILAETVPNDFDQTDSNGSTILDYAARNPNASVCSRVSELSTGANVSPSTLKLSR